MPPLIEPALWHWIAFVVFIAVMLAVDLLLVSRTAQEPTFRESLFWTAVWIGMALAFNVAIWWMAGMGPKGIEAAARFLTGYLIELSLSLDNVFVFVVIFSFFKVERQNQRGVLFWGILGAVVMRLIFVVVGIQLIHYFTWVLPLMGLVIVYLGAQLAMHKEPNINPDKNLLLRLGRRWLPMAEGEHPDRFFVRGSNGRRQVTTLFLVLLVIESVDVVFALDSVPAIFGVTQDPFIVFSSNVLAILGLRSLYFLLAGFLDRFQYINYGISAVLVFIGATMALDFPAKRFGWIEAEHELVPYSVSLLTVVTLLAASIGASLMWAPRKHE